MQGREANDLDMRLVLLRGTKRLPQSAVSVTGAVNCWAVQARCQMPVEDKENGIRRMQTVGRPSFVPLQLPDRVSVGALRRTALDDFAMTCCGGRCLHSNRGVSLRCDVAMMPKLPRTRAQLTRAAKMVAVWYSPCVTQ